ncbi:hypothetical protein FD755_017597 [Muntiacus reevesi]|uniref:RNA polymerase II subunit A C-terminal domain phosphatase SSU72 n=1 Tax=Muntiacus reevesi TaxID=9886 RepID=A0A5N3XFI9_MUNRE|nr:hypothetical protein FD755_017597 [Muntiacus reevesi]
MPSYPLSVAVVCMSNMNRSMEAHRILRRKGFRVQVVYDFSTTYEEMRKDLARRDRERYNNNGILHILGRNERIKPRPERFQECRDRFDVIFTCEESVYDRVVEELWVREQETCQPVHVINVDMDDNAEDATLGAFIICELCERLQQADDLEDSLVEVLLAAERKTGKSFLHTVCFY